MYTFWQLSRGKNLAALDDKKRQKVKSRKLFIFCQKKCFSPRLGVSKSEKREKTGPVRQFLRLLNHYGTRSGFRCNSREKILEKGEKSVVQ